MSGKRSYEDGCATAHALDLIGERWALLVVRELMLGPKRFTDLRGGMPGISPNVLTQRLEELEVASIVRRRKLPPPAAAWVYELTEWGLELEPVIKAVGRWAARSPTLPEDLPMSINSLILSFRTMFDAASASDFSCTIELRLGENRFCARIESGQLEIKPGQAEIPDAIVISDPNALAAVVYGGQKLNDAERQGDITLTGNVSLVERFVSLFPLPAAAPANA